MAENNQVEVKVTDTILEKAIVACFTHKVKAYEMICFEQEAYANQSNYQYNKSRKHYAWVKWLFKYKVA